MTPADARYGGGLVAGSKLLEIVGDLATELAIREGGDEGLCVAYDSVEFLAPVYAGDFVEARARILEVGRTSRSITADVERVIAAGEGGRAAVLEVPQPVARVSGTLVIGSADLLQGSGDRIES